MHTTQQVAVTYYSDLLQRQILPCVVENFFENLWLRNRILLGQHVTKNQIRQNWCNLLRQENSFAETKIFTKILQDSRSINLSLWCVAATSCPARTHRVIHRHELLLQLVTYSVFLPLRQRANVNMYHVTRFSFYWLPFYICTKIFTTKKCSFAWVSSKRTILVCTAFIYSFPILKICRMLCAINMNQNLSIVIITQQF